MARSNAAKCAEFGACGVGVGVGVAVGLGVGDGVGVDVGAAVGSGPRVGDGVMVAVGRGVEVGFGGTVGLGSLLQPLRAAMNTIAAMAITAENGLLRRDMRKAYRFTPAERVTRLCEISRIADVWKLVDQ